MNSGLSQVDRALRDWAASATLPSDCCSFGCRSGQLCPGLPLQVFMPVFPHGIQRHDGHLARWHHETSIPTLKRTFPDLPFLSRAGTLVNRHYFLHSRSPRRPCRRNHLHRHYHNHRLHWWRQRDVSRHVQSELSGFPRAIGRLGPASCASCAGTDAPGGVWGLGFRVSQGFGSSV